MRLILVLLCGLVFWVSQVLAAPRLLLLSPTKLRLGFYGTITGEDFSLLLEENQVFVLPQGADEPVSVPVTKVIRVQGSETQMKITFILSPNVLPEPPRTNVPAEVWVVTNGEESNHLNFTIVPAPAITEVNPPQAYPGDEIDVEITTFRTRLRPRGLSLNFGPGVQVSNINVTGPTSLTAHLQIAEDAPLGKRDVILRLGRLVIRGYQLFEVVPPPSQAQTLKVEVQEPPKVVFTPTVTVKGTVGIENVSPTPPPPPAVITSVIPATAKQGQRLTLNLAGQNTHFSQEKTQVLLGQGVTVEVLRVQDETHLQVDIYVAPEAEAGPRNIQVITGEEVALSPIAFNIQRGYGVIKGYLIDPEGNPIAGAEIKISNLPLKTFSNNEGYFELHNIPSGENEIIISASNYPVVRLFQEIKAGETIDLTKPIATNPNLKGIVIAPLGPPPEIRQLSDLLHQGFSSFVNNLSENAAKELIKKSIILVGGNKLGVIDEKGRQLNPNISGFGLLSLKPEGVDSLFLKWSRGETYLLGDIFLVYTFLIDWNELPTLSYWIRSLNEYLSENWNSNNEDILLWKLVFSDKEIKKNPPIISADYILSAPKAFLVFSWMLAESVEYAKQHFTPFDLSYKHMYAFNDMIFSDSWIFLAQNDNNTSGSNQNDDFSKAKTFLKKYLLGKAQQIPTSNVQGDIFNWLVKGDESKVLKLILNENTSDFQEKLISKYAQFFNKNKKELIFHLKSYYDRNALKEVYDSLKAEAISGGRLNAFVDLVSDTMKSFYSAVVGDILTFFMQPIFKTYQESFIKLATPDPPHIEKIEMKTDITPRVVIKFSPCPQDKYFWDLVYHRVDPKLLENKYPKFYYEVWRRLPGTGFHRILVKKSWEIPIECDENNRCFYVLEDDSIPSGFIGMITYRMTTIVRHIKSPPAPSVELFTNGYLYQIGTSFLSGNYVNPANLLNWGTSFLKMAEEIYQAIAFIRGPISPSKTIYFNPFYQPHPRLDLQVAHFFVNKGQPKEFLSVSDVGYIFSLDNGLKKWVYTNFAAPHQKGLAIDKNGFLYTENAASEERFGGKIFQFVPSLTDPSQGERIFPWIGTIMPINFMRLSMFGGAIPVNLVDMAYGVRPGHGEGIYILNLTYNDLRFLSFNNTVSSPILFLSSLSTYARLAYNFFNGEIYFSNFDAIYSLDPELCRGKICGEDDLTLVYSDFDLVEISGLVFDFYHSTYTGESNLYFIDYWTGDLYVLPPLSVKAYLIYSDFLHPLDIDISADGKYLLVVDARGVHRLPLLIPYSGFDMLDDGWHQFVDADGKPVQALKKGNYLFYPANAASNFYFDRLETEGLVRYLVSLDDYIVHIKTIKFDNNIPQNISVKTIHPLNRFKEITYQVANDIDLVEVIYPDTYFIPENEHLEAQDIFLSDNFSVPISWFDRPDILLLTPRSEVISSDNVTFMGFLFNCDADQLRIKIASQDIYVYPQENGFFKVNVQLSDGVYWATLEAGQCHLGTIVRVNRENAQSQLITLVIDPITHQPRAGVRLSVKETGQEVFSDSQGVAVLPDLVPGRIYHLEIGFPEE